MRNGHDVSTTLSLNYAFVALQLMLAAAFGFTSSILVTVQVLPAWQAGSPLPAGWTFLALAAVYLGSVSFFVYWIYWAYSRTHVYMTRDALVQGGVIRPKAIRWSDVRRIRSVGVGFHVEGESQTIVFAPFVYRGPASAAQRLFQVARQSGAPV